jgi:60 kDa SS-A/Ro ribonucleoprotein
MTKANRLYKGTSASAPAKLSPTYQKADKVNKEGFPAFTRTMEEDVLSVLTTQTLGNTYYASAKELAKDLVAVIEKAADADPKFLAQALVYARNKGLMKLAPTVALVVLAAREGKNVVAQLDVEIAEVKKQLATLTGAELTKAEADLKALHKKRDKVAKKDNFRKAFKHVVKTPDDLREFVSLCRTKTITDGFGGVTKVAAQNFLRHLSEFHGVKYGSAKSEGITLRDILRMAHPRESNGHEPSCGNKKAHERLKNGAQKELFSWLVKGWEGVGSEPSKTNPMVWALETIKRTDDEARIIELVKEYRLPHEVVVPSVKKMTTGIWKALAEGMPYMALLRNLNTLHEHGVFDDKDVVKAVAKRISDKENVLNSKQLPFRFSNAFRMFKGAQEIREAIGDALEVSFVNVPKIKGRVCVSNDISDSMRSPVADKSKARCTDIAGVLAASIFKSNDDTLLVPFDDVAHPELGRVSKRDSVMSIAEKVGILRGGTNLGAPIAYLTQQREKVDVFIGLTDNEDWSGRGFLTEWEEYKKKVNKDAKAFLVTLAPHRDYVAPKGYPDVYFIMGWSPSILTYIPTQLEKGVGQVEAVRAIELSSFGKKVEAKVEETEVEAEAD